MATRIGKAFGLGAVLALTGCLFVGDINQRPAAQLVADQVSVRLGTTTSVLVYLEDDQRDVAIGAVLRDAAGVAASGCTARLSEQAYDDATRRLDVVAWVPGTYTLEVVPTDALGARGSSATVQLQFADLPIAFTSAPMVRYGRAPDACQASFSARQAIPLALDEAATDPDGGAQVPPPFGCAALTSPVEYTWHISLQPSGNGSVGPTNALGGCDEVPSVSADTYRGGPTACLYPDPDVSPAKASTYTVTVGASDATSAVDGTTVVVPVVGESPACLDGAYPPASADRYLVPGDQPTAFQAIGVDDTTPASALRYRWSLARPGAGTYDVLVDDAVGTDGGGRLSFDPVALGLSIGDRVSLRVEVTQPEDDHTASCDVADDACPTASCVTPGAPVCPRRATWYLELR